MSPQRIQRKRTKGWRMPEGAVYVGRPSKWGNVYRVEDRHPVHGRVLTTQEAVEEFRAYMGRMVVLQRHARAELAGLDLVCWCPLDSPCHADVLLEIANGGDSS